MRGDSRRVYITNVLIRLCRFLLCLFECENEERESAPVNFSKRAKEERNLKSGEKKCMNKLQTDPKRNGDGKGGFWSENGSVNDQNLLEASDASRVLSRREKKSQIDFKRGEEKSNDDYQLNERNENDTARIWCKNGRMNDQSLLVDASQVSRVSSERRVSKIGRLLCLVLLGQVHIGESVCLNTMLDARDSRGKHCQNGQYSGGNNCGLYDNSNFTANQMCCQCGGGFTWDLGTRDNGWDASAKYCYDDTGNGQLHSSGGT